MQNRHVDDLIDAYALGALEPGDVDAVERHLEACEQCRALLARARRQADLLLHAVPLVTPPPSLRGRLMERIAAEKAAAHEPSSAANGVSPSATPSGPMETSETSREPSPAQQGYLRRVMRALRGQPEGTEHAAGDLLRDLLADPHCIIWPVAGTDAAPDASARFVAAPQRRDAVFVASGLRRPGTGKAYQVWLLRGGRPLPNALFAVGRGGVGASIVRADEPWRDFETVAVTPEPEGGSPAPTGPIVLAGSLVESAG